MRNKEEQYVLYISSNDGSDMRINKEIRTMLKKASIVFLGVGDPQYCFLKHPGLEVVLIDGERKSFFTIFKQFVIVFRLLLSKKITSIHVINEQLMLFFWPLLWSTHVVLDVFDSIFLKANIAPDSLVWLKKLVYAPIDMVLVTDENRKNLMPNFLQKRILVLPNYPEEYSGAASKTQDSAPLTILFFGWLGMNRGGSIVKGLLEANDHLRIIMLGWFSDQECEILSTQERVDYRGVVPQQEALEIAATEADYILCVYEPINLNNINASPNKIYDAIQTSTPLIINDEIKVAALVRQLEIGIVIPTYYPDDYKTLAAELEDKKSAFSFSSDLKKRYTWETIEAQLFAAHQL